MNCLDNYFIVDVLDPDTDQHEAAVNEVVLQAMAPEKVERYEPILHFRDELSELPI